MLQLTKIEWSNMTLQATSLLLVSVRHIRTKRSRNEMIETMAYKYTLHARDLSKSDGDIAEHDKITDNDGQLIPSALTLYLVFDRTLKKRRQIRGTTLWKLFEIEWILLRKLFEIVWILPLHFNVRLFWQWTSSHSKWLDQNSFFSSRSSELMGLAKIIISTK